MPRSVEEIKKIIDEADEQNEKEMGSWEHFKELLAHQIAELSKEPYIERDGNEVRIYGDATKQEIAEIGERFKTIPPVEKPARLLKLHNLILAICKDKYSIPEMMAERITKEVDGYVAKAQQFLWDYSMGSFNTENMNLEEQMYFKADQILALMDAEKAGLFEEIEQRRQPTRIWDGRHWCYDYRFGEGELEALKSRILGDNPLP